MTSKKNHIKSNKNYKFPKILILIITAIISFFLLIIPDIINKSVYPLRQGEVTSQEILAPYSHSYESDVLTTKAKQTASANVESVYLPADPSISRHQIENLNNTLYYISNIRSDAFASVDEKINDLMALEKNNLSKEMADMVLSLSNQKWDLIQNEAKKVLEQVMRNTIRTPNLSSIKNNVVSLMDFSLTEDQVNIIFTLVEPFIVPNSLFSEEKTNEAKELAENSVEPIKKNFVAGEVLVQRGQLIDAEDLEALEQFGLIKPENQYQEIIASGTLVVISSVLIGLYYPRRQPTLLNKNKSLILIAIVFLLFLAFARFFIINRTLLPYAYPIAAFGLTLTIIFNLEIAIVFSVILGILSAYGTTRGLDLTLFYIIPTIIGILSIRRARRIASFFGAGISIGLSGVCVVLAFRLGDSVTDWIGIASIGAASILNGIAAASLTLLLQFIFSQLLDITTPLQLLDTARPDHPLLQFILRNAPGSYQHSLQVSNLAEQAAESIEADTLLIRVGAIYHDCGKALNPQFFIENQVKDQINSHDDIDPATAASIIIKHVLDGIDLAKKYHLPSRVLDFIKEHHGTLLTQYQYNQAIKNAGDASKVDPTLFQYPGPPPQSKETALLMLADGLEARARAENPKDELELKLLISKVIDYYKNQNQLNQTNLTLKDLEKIAESFFNTLQGIYHPRILYPENKIKEK